MPTKKNNYQHQLDEIIASIPEGQTPTLFLHACCAPCSSYVLEYLNKYFEITLFFYNPNITEEPEYVHRREELKRLLCEMPLENPVHFMEGEYAPDRFFALAKGFEQAPERGPRCVRCLGHRLEVTYAVADTLPERPDYVGTTLSISPHKDADFLNQKGEALASSYEIPWLYADFKKKGGYQRSIALSHEYNLYRQNYCGCIYSKQAAEQRTPGG